MKRTLILTAATLFAAGCNSGETQRTTQHAPAQNQPEANYYTQGNTAQNYSDFVGARGPDGPVGAKGAQGPTGQTGAAGYAMAGPRGEAGPAGPKGEQGRTGAQGPAGTFTVGPAGEAGPAGQTGAQGAIGQTGSQGASAAGLAGPAGPAGPTGPQGPTGDTGTQGPTLVGPAGPAGRAGATGAQGEAGRFGAQGNTTAGVAGAVGPAGPAGPQGPMGPTGVKGTTGVIERWVSYRDYWFDNENAVVHESDAYKSAKIAAYMNAHPSLQLSIDGSSYPRATTRHDIDLADDRVTAVRNSLIAAGVPAYRISTGSFGDMNLRRDGRVEVLIKTDQLALMDPSSVNERWTSYQDFWFEGDKSIVHASDANKVTDIAAYMKQNPSMQIGIDSSMNSNVTNQRDLDLAKRRGNAVRDSLIAAGVPASSIKTGSFGDIDLRRDGRVEVLFRNDQIAHAQ